MAEKRIQVVFDDRAVEQLERIRVASGAASTAEVLRNALGFYEWVRKQVASGNTLAIIDNKRDVVRQFITPFELEYGGRDG